jgi:hypothetical protein
MKGKLLSEFDLKPGDKVRLVGWVDGESDDRNLVYTYYEKHPTMEGINFPVVVRDNFFWVDVRSRIALYEKLDNCWDNLSESEKTEILIAWDRGDTIEWSSTGKVWSFKTEGRFAPKNYYRIRPRKKLVELHGYYLEDDNGSHNCLFDAGNPVLKDDTHKITFEVVDGKPVLESIRLEEIDRNVD